MIIGLSLPLLIGITALGVEVGVWYALRTQYQSAADAAAIAGAYAIVSGDTASLAAIALNDAVLNGADPATSSGIGGRGCTGAATEICARTPTANSAEIFLSQPQGPGMAVLHIAGVTILTHAVATVEPGSGACMFALDPAGPDIVFNGNPTIDLGNCGLASLITGGTSITFKGSKATLRASGIIAVGGILQNATGNQLAVPTNAIVTNITNSDLWPVDPYVTVAVPVGGIPTGSCVAGGDVKAGTPAPAPNTLYCGPLRFETGANVTLSPGVYYVDGGNKVQPNKNVGFEIDAGATVNGTGVTIVLTATGSNKVGSVQILAGASGTLTAPAKDHGLLPPDAAASAGLLIYQDPTKPVQPNEPNTIVAGAPAGSCANALKLVGAIYTSKSVDVLTGGSDYVQACSGCTELLAASFQFSGSSTFLAGAGCDSAGVHTGGGRTVVLTE